MALFYEVPLWDTFKELLIYVTNLKISGCVMYKPLNLKATSMAIKYVCIFVWLKYKCKVGINVNDRKK